MKVRRAGLSWWVVVVACVMLVGAPLGLATSAAADPVTVASAPAPAVNVSSLSSGRYASCAVRSDGTLACWGDKTSAAAQLVPPAGEFTQVSSGQDYSCGVRSDRTLACWGQDRDGLLSPPEGFFSSVSAGPEDACAVRSDDGTVTCWGQTGLTAPQKAFSSVSVGELFACGLVAADSTVACWGSLGSGDPDLSRVPPTGEFTSVSAGWYHVCGVRIGGTVTCWGGYAAPYGRGETTPPTDTFTAVSAGFYSSCGITTKGTLTCWGDSQFGHNSTPVGQYKAVSNSSYFGCAVRTEGTVSCWGSNQNGLLGVAPAVPSPAPATATVGQAYTHTFTSGTGTPAGRFALAGGTLPDGLTLSADGVISGTPTSSGASTFTVAAWDGVFPTATQPFTLTVQPPLDTTPPTTTIALDPSSPTGSNGWYTGPVTATVTATDGGDGGNPASGVASTQCALDPATAPTRYGQPPLTDCPQNGTGRGFKVSAEGAHTVYAASVDTAGNTETVRTASFKIDSLAPTLNPVLPATILLHQSGVTVSPGAADSVSGVATSSCDPVDTRSAGDHILTCRATDNAGLSSTSTVHYTVQYRIVGFASPLPASSVTAGSAVPVKVALADVNNVLVPDAEAQALVTAKRVTFGTSGAQTLTPQPMTYSTSADQFQYGWKTSKSPVGPTTLAVTVTYPGATTTTTLTSVVTLAK